MFSKFGKKKDDKPAPAPAPAAPAANKKDVKNDTKDTRKPSVAAAPPALPLVVEKMTPAMEADQQKLFELLDSQNKKSISLADAKMAIWSQSLYVTEKQWQEDVAALKLKEYIKLFQKCLARGRLTAPIIQDAFKKLAPAKGDLNQDYMHRILVGACDRLKDNEVMQVFESGQLVRPNRTIVYQGIFPCG